MCGIAGEFSFNRTLKEKKVYLAMQDSLKDRGPDQNGIYMDEQAALVHTRLAIVDIERGLQPMIETIDEKQIVLVYNGELYNTEELKDECIKHGFEFKTHSDTEVVLKSYCCFKEKCVEKMNGIFAFVIYDQRDNSMFYARDRIGVKPLFIVMNDQRFLFASQIKALLAHPDVEPVIDENSLYELICIGPGRTPGQGVFRDIAECPPACCGIVKDGKKKQWQYWELKDAVWEADFEQTKKLVRQTVQDAIERQLVSDVKVCTFLSGGLDSSIISAVAAKKFKEKNQSLDTISVEYTDNERFFKPSFFQPNRDEHYVDVMVKSIGSNHHSVILDNGKLADALYAAVEARDLPGMVDVDSSLLLFCKEIKKIATVALSGECADEIFGGYPWFRDEKMLNSSYFPWSEDIDYRLSFLKPKYRLMDGKKYVLDRVNKTKSRADKLDGNSEKQNRMKEMMKLNMEWFMQTLLDRKDRMSMANGLEVRVPFCDYRLVEMLYRIPWEMKEANGREKGLLREAFRDLLPEEITDRKKSPYPKTHHPEYTAKVKGMLEAILDDKNEPLHLYFDEARLRKLLNEDSEIPWYGQLMTTPQTIAYFVQINYWLKHYHVRFEGKK